MSLWYKLFPHCKPIIAMIHLQALPGTPANVFPLKKIAELAVEEAKLYQKLGVHAVIIENMHDVPYLNREVGHEITASMSVIAAQIRQCLSIPCGIQILAGANHAALAVAQAAELDFIRAEGFVYGHVADEGYMDACAPSLLRYRKMIGAEHIAVLTDIKKKHSAHSITSDVTIGETAKTAEFFLSDGLIVTGISTAQPTDINDLTAAKASSQLPVIIGSGITANNLKQYYHLADGFIVGSYFKKNGIWSNPLDSERISSFVSLYQELSEHPS